MFWARAGLNPLTTCWRCCARGSASSEEDDLGLCKKCLKKLKDEDLIAPYVVASTEEMPCGRTVGANDVQGHFEACEDCQVP